MRLILSRRRRAGRFLFRAAVVWIFNWGGVCAGAEEGLFERSSMTEIEREGVRIRLGRPIQVTSQLPWQVRVMGQEKVDSGGWDMGWAFLHPVPCIARFPGGELMVTYSLVPDTNANPMDITGLQISRDGGKTWGRRHTILPGRPGIGLWFSTDGRGKDWQQIDIMDYHNRQVPDSTYRIGSWGNGKTQTSAYTEMVEVSPNRLLLVYDRGAKPKPAHTSDLSRIFVLPVEVERPGELKVR